MPKPRKPKKDPKALLSDAEIARYHRAGKALPKKELAKLVAAAKAENVVETPPSPEGLEGVAGISMLHTAGDQRGKLAPSTNALVDHPALLLEIEEAAFDVARAAAEARAVAKASRMTPYQYNKLMRTRSTLNTIVERFSISWKK